MSDAQSLERFANGNTADSAVNGLAGINKRSLNFIFGAQKVILDEMVDLGNDALERSQAELSVANEFVAKIAEAHSAKGFREVYDECGKHQVDFFQRDSERVFKHWQRFLDRTSKLFLNSPPDRPAA
jgi:hypothetical protein